MVLTYAEKFESFLTPDNSSKFIDIVSNAIRSHCMIYRKALSLSTLSIVMKDNLQKLYEPSIVYQALQGRGFNHKTLLFHTSIGCYQKLKC